MRWPAVVAFLAPKCGNGFLSDFVFYFSSKEKRMAVELDDRTAGARRLKDKVCVVTGAGQGIGRATARRLGQEGGTVVVADRIDASATEALADLRNHGVEAIKAIVDLGRFAGAQNLMSQTLDAYGRIDVLVNNVGGTIWMKPYHLYTDKGVGV
jgi:dihydroxycyclohexadiene carboxylate dehydrogenase